jgi:hypothetical protein
MRGRTFVIVHGEVRIDTNPNVAEPGHASFDVKRISRCLTVKQLVAAEPHGTERTRESETRV